MLEQKLLYMFLSDVSALGETTHAALSKLDYPFHWKKKNHVIMSPKLVDLMDYLFMLLNWRSC